jgi:hypothetical protein
MQGISGGTRRVADIHTADPVTTDPDVAPNHPEVRDTFPATAIAFCWGIAALAIVLGIILGLTLANN